MPTSKTYGTEGAANKAIGGVPTLHYFDFASKGRGQVIRLLWEVYYSEFRSPSLSSKETDTDAPPRTQAYPTPTCATASKSTPNSRNHSSRR